MGLEKKGIVFRTKEEKRKEKRLKEKEKRQKKKRRLYKQQEKEQEFDDFSDKVMFNDVVHAPPKLPGIRGHPANNEARRPGQNKDLLLLNNKKGSQSNVGKVKKEKESKTKKKMKQRISLAKQQMQENDRISIVEQYRALKQKK